MSQPVNVEELSEVVKQIAAKVKELKLDAKLKEEIEKLEDIVLDIRDWLNRVPRFEIRPTSLLPIENLKDAEVEFRVQGYEFSDYIKVGGKFGSVKVIDVYREFFEKDYILSMLLRRYVEILANIAKAVRENYDLVEKLRQIEESISDP